MRSGPRRHAPAPADAAPGPPGRPSRREVVGFSSGHSLPPSSMAAVRTPGVVRGRHGAGGRERSPRWSRQPPARGASRLGEDTVVCVGSRRAVLRPARCLRRSAAGRCAGHGRKLRHRPGRGCAVSRTGLSRGDGLQAACQRRDGSGSNQECTPRRHDLLPRRASRPVGPFTSCSVCRRDQGFCAHAEVTSQSAVCICVDHGLMQGQICRCCCD